MMLIALIPLAWSQYFEIHRLRDEVIRLQGRPAVERPRYRLLPRKDPAPAPLAVPKALTPPPAPYVPPKLSTEAP